MAARSMSMYESSPLTVSVVVPVYHGEQSLPELVKRISDTLEPLANQFEIILVNDGSRDGSWEKICSHIPRSLRPLSEQTPVFYPERD